MLEKIGVFGGTFDPVHLGHIALIKKAIKVLKLNKLYVVPNGNPPHKEGEINPLYRLDMVKSATKGIKNAEVCDYEIKKEGYSYTYETLYYFKEKHPNCQLYFIMGMDNLANISNWKKPEEIFKTSDIAFFGRSSYVADFKLIDEIKNKYNAKIEIFDFDFFVSSTEIKEKLKNGDYIFDKISINTFRNIIKNGLYQTINVSEYDYYEKELSKYVEEKRFNHSLGVACTAYLLAIKYNYDAKLAYFTGLLHDIAKRLSLEEQLELCKNIDLHPDELKYTKMLHAPAGAGLVEKKYNIKDEKILNAIRLHTIGDENMTLLDKIIYMADYIEPYRDFDGLGELREMAFNNIDKAIIKGIDTTILSLIEENLKISPVMLTVRNGLIEKEKK